MDLWKAHRDSVSGRALEVVYADRPELVCEFVRAPEDDVISLIAASPALLRAAEKALEEIDAHWTQAELEARHCGMEVARGALISAIKAAKGG